MKIEVTDCVDVHGNDCPLNYDDRDCRARRLHCQYDESVGGGDFWLNTPLKARDEDGVPPDCPLLKGEVVVVLKKVKSNHSD